ncbi:MAG: ATP synthase subunit 8 [Bogoriella megaspora]|nr:MAG: ATP synthase subunit 8 [Bogoriella megaspora]
MSSSRILRTFPAVRSALRQPTASRAFMSTQTAKVASTSAMMKKDAKPMPSFTANQPAAPKWGQLPPSFQSGSMIPLYAAMPQLVPFYFVNEVTVAFIALPTMIYILSKYTLPQKVRLFLARMFISKL